MTVGTERDQILERIVSEFAAHSDMVHLELGRASTMLAPPSIPLKYLPAKTVVSFCFQPQARSLLS